MAGQAALDAVWAAESGHLSERLIDREPTRQEVYLCWTDDADYWEDHRVDGRIAALMHHDSQVNGAWTASRAHPKTAAKSAGHGIAYAEGFKRITLS